jgi:hypothetical protein
MAIYAVRIILSTVTFSLLQAFMKFSEVYSSKGNISKTWIGILNLEYFPT